MENKFTYLRRKIFFLRRIFGLLPYQKIFRRLDNDIPDLYTWNALDIFAGDGEQSSLDMKKYISDIELWENNPEHELSLKNKFPNSIVKIVDSYSEIDNVKEKYNIVLVDNWPRILSGYCEHFDLFPKVVNIMKNRSVLIILTMPKINNAKLFSKEHLKLRKFFYNTDNAIEIPMVHMVKAYERFINENNFKLIDWFCVDRWFLYKFTKWFRTKKLCFLVLRLEKNGL